MSQSGSEDPRPQDPGSSPGRPAEGGSEGSAAPELLDDIQAVGRGEAGQDAWRRIHDAYYGRLRRLFARRGAAPEERRDLTQETFFRVFQGRGTFSCLQQFEAWLFHIAANVGRNALRSAKAAKRDAPEESLAEWIDERGFAPRSAEPGPLERPLDSLLAKERVMLLARELQGLPPRMRQCALLRFFQDLSYDEIARQLRISVGAVKAHLHQARHRLNERLDSHLQPVDDDPLEPDRDE